MVLSAGALDSTFGTGGLVVNDVGASSDLLHDVAVQTDGKVVGAGFTRPDIASDADMIVARYLNDGSLDSSFGSGGIVMTDFGNKESDWGQSVALQSDGKIVVGGITNVHKRTQPGDDDWVFALARYNSDGTLDTTFGNSKGKLQGLVTTDVSPDSTQDWLTDVIVQPDDNKILVVGSAAGSDGREVALARYDTDGSLDPTFGNDGIVLTPASDFSTRDGVGPMGLVFDSGETDDFFVGAVAPPSSSLESETYVLRYDADGDLKTDSRIPGIYGNDIAIDDGDIYIGGHTEQLQADGRTRSMMSAVKVKVDATTGKVELDTEFGSDGYAVIPVSEVWPGHPWPEGTAYSEGTSIVVESGKAIVSGFRVRGYDDFQERDSVVARFTESGDPDEMFNGTGVHTTSFSTVGYEDSHSDAVTLQDNGKVIAAGYASYNGNRALALTRYHGDRTGPKSIRISDASVTEGDSGTVNAVFEVFRTGEGTDTDGVTTTVHFETADDTAIAGDDYIANDGTVEFGTGDTVQTITVEVLGDSLIELDETFTVTLTKSSPSEWTIDDNEGVGTIIDNEDGPRISVGDVEVYEGDSGTTDAIFTVSITESADVSVDYVTENGTAKAGSDYTATSGTLTFVSGGDLTQTVTVAVVGDTEVEPNETFDLVLSNISDPSSVGFADDRATATILNDETELIGYWPFDGDGADRSGGGRDLDLFGGVGFANDGLFGQSLDLHNDGTQYAQRPIDDDIFDFGASDFTIQTWVNFNNTDREQTLFEKLAGATGPGWTLTKIEESSGSDQWHFFSSPSAVLTSSEDTTISTDGWHHVVVRSRDDVFDMFVDSTLVASKRDFDAVPDTSAPLLVGKRTDDDGRNFAVDGRIDEVAVWTGALSDAEIEGLYNEGTGTPALPPSPGITVSPTSGLVTSEDGATASFEVVLDTEPTADVTIGLSSSDPTEGTVDQSSLTFTTFDWDTAQTVIVTGVDDNEEDGDIAYTIVTDAASSDDGDYNGLDPADVSVTNLDNDAPAGGGMYVWDIEFESRTRGKGGKFHDEKIHTTIQSDSDGNGTDSGDDRVANASVTVTLWQDDGDGVLESDDTQLGTFSGTTDDTGVFSTDWIKDLPDGTYWAEVTELTHGSLTWNTALDPTANDDDADGDGDPDQVHIIGGSALLADTSGPGGSSVEALTESALQPVTEEAIAHWQSSGSTSTSETNLNETPVRVANLSGSLLGMTSPSGVVWIDRDAAGHGWSVETPSGGVNLQSVITHELGHILGLEHSDEHHDVMAPTLAIGQQQVLPDDMNIGVFPSLRSGAFQAADSPVTHPQRERATDEVLKERLDPWAPVDGGSVTALAEVNDQLRVADDQTDDQEEDERDRLFAQWEQESADVLPSALTKKM